MMWWAAPALGSEVRKVSRRNRQNGPLFFCGAANDANGTKQALAGAMQMSAFGGEADMMQTSRVKIFRFDSPEKCL
jgi:hypothetical protein